MISNSKNIAVNLKTCINNECDRNCSKSECRLCLNCVDDVNLQNMHRAYREHRNRGGFQRIFPTNKASQEKKIELTINNQISAKWFDEKCHLMSDWC